MIIFIYRNKLKHDTKNIAIGMTEFLTSHGVKVVVEDGQENDIIEASPYSSVKPEEINFCISLGGDGTILKIIHSFPKLDAPILGVNLGGLGFLADLPVTNIYAGLQDIINGNYHIQNRLIMDGQTVKNEKCIAVNEITFHRASNPTLVDLAIHIDGTYIDTFSADGVIISTPCGSTAYSLAAGGPILYPELDAIVLTPICPHTISNRPIVLPCQEMNIQYISNLDPIQVTSDGLANFEISTGEVFYIRPSKRKFRLVKLIHHDYFTTLRTKLHWSGKLRP